MTGIGSLIGGAIGAASSLYGGWKASKAMKGVKNSLESEKRANANWYDRRYNEDPTQRVDAQRLLTLTADNIRSRNRAAAGTAAVTGGTEAALAATKAANAQAMADTVSQIAAQGERRKDDIERQYITRDAALQAQLNQMDVARANAITQAAGGVATAAGNAGSALDQVLLERAKLAAGAAGK